ncbi:bone marrow stromal antigen 2 isoform X1 [Dipodomys merriami]|uniref:bone marrow stromal antigen 2 isoform X1 n=1 Tax=Dipodomys merriami TaxID=94247 RepID=UPI003855E60A
MAPALYHRPPAPAAPAGPWPREAPRGCGRAALLLLLLLAGGLAAALGVVRARCAPARGCGEDPALRDRARACNRTLDAVAADLERTHSENRERQEQIRSLREENARLRRRLRDAEAELQRLRQDRDSARRSPEQLRSRAASAPRTPTTTAKAEASTLGPEPSAERSAARGPAAPGLLVTAGLLLLSLGAPRS